MEFKTNVKSALMLINLGVVTFRQFRWSGPLEIMSRMNMLE